MTDMIPPPAPASNIAEYTVSEISGALKRTVEEAFGYVRVRGEISGFRGRHSSGHCYFTLKDERSRLEAVIWRGVFEKLRFPPEEGMEVIASGKLSTFPGSSKYQIIVDNIEPAGAGALMALLEARKKKLAAEGIFDEARKKPLPALPKVIGVVTSPTGAVIRDIIHRISDRFPLRVLVWPVRVQGETAGQEAAAAIAGFNNLKPDGSIARPDVIILARGGGSLEDLWGFNDEELVRAIYASKIPVISAIGHETDWTLADLAADMRAPTPTGAAEMAVPVKARLVADLADDGARLNSCVTRLMDRHRQALRSAARALPSADQLLALPRRSFDETAARLIRALAANTERKRLRFSGVRLSSVTLERMVRERRRNLAAVSARMRPEPLYERLRTRCGRIADLVARSDRVLVSLLERRRRSVAETGRMLASLAYPAVLARGYAIVSDREGNPITRALNVSPGKALTVQFTDGKIGVTVEDNDKRAAPAKSRKSPASSSSGNQGTLF